MSAILTQKQEMLSDHQHRGQRLYAKIHPLLLTWELYPILIIAAFLRLYHINNATFVDDDTVLFRLAHDFFAHGLFSLSGNRSSFGQLYPPMVVYFFMIPAAISANPLGGEIMDALFNLVAVLVCYFFTRRYYGRIAGTSAALLYATAVKAVLYSRNIWQPNLMPLLTLLFMWMLFRGVVERRKGWVVPAIALICMLYQLHASAVLLSLPLVVAIVLAFRTIRWYDIVLSLLVALILFAPYLYLENKTDWQDLRIVYSSVNHPAYVDNEAISWYRPFLSPYVHSFDINDHSSDWPSDPFAVLNSGKLHYLQLPMVVEYEFIWWLLGASIFAAIMLVLIPQAEIEEEKGHGPRRKNILLAWLMNLYVTPFRLGVLLLLCWQGAILALIRHNVGFNPHYFIIFLPGQFILLGIFIGQVVKFFQRYRPDCARAIRYGSYVLVTLIVSLQFAGSASGLIDLARGHFDPTTYYPNSYNDLTSLQNALNKADQLAQARHIHRIYVSVTAATQNPTRYLAEQMKTPVTTFDAGHCTLLPGTDAGPVVFLNDQSDSATEAYIKQYTHAALIAQPARLADPPFNLYVLSATATSSSLPMTGDLQLIDQQAHAVSAPAENQESVMTRWRIMNSAKPEPFMSYNFQFQLQPGKTGGLADNFSCGASALWAGDQLLVTKGPVDRGSMPTSIDLQVNSFVSSPEQYALGALKLTTFNISNSQWKAVTTVDGKNTIILPIS